MFPSVGFSKQALFNSLLGVKAPSNKSNRLHQAV